jgi:hypothetical protein
LPGGSRGLGDVYKRQFLDIQIALGSIMALAAC